MNIRSHYDLPNNCIVDLEIRKLGNPFGHSVSILARGKNSLCKTVLPCTDFKALAAPVVTVKEVRSPYTFSTETIIEVLDEDSQECFVHFKFRTDLNTAFILTNNTRKSFTFK